MAVVAGVLYALLGLAILVLAFRRPGEDGDEDQDAEAYLRSLDWDTGEADEFEALLQEPFFQRIVRPIAQVMIGLVQGVLPGNYRDRVHERLVHAGLVNRYRAEEVVAGQVVLGVVGFGLALLMVIVGAVSTNAGVLLLVLFPVLGAQLPNTLVRRAIDERQGAIRRDLPDTLDLLAISVEAGVGFEGALGIVSDNFDSVLAEEFSRTLREMELGLPRRQALENLKRRTEVPELSNFILTLTQADALGMPIGRVLKTQAGELRLKRRAWAREKAAKLPVKILFPLMPILLATFIVILGPAGATIGEAF